MKSVAANRRARYDFELSEKIEAGMVLTGPEVKSCRAGHVQLAGSYVSFLNGKPLLKNASISRYSMSGPETIHAEKRDRVLLMKKGEIDRLLRATEEKGMTIVPLEMLAGRHIKLVIAVGRGRKRLDKRHAIKERETGRKLREGREI